MARETKVGLLIGVGVILLIAIIVNNLLVTDRVADDYDNLAEFAHRTQEDLGTPGSTPAPGSASGAQSVVEAPASVARQSEQDQRATRLTDSTDVTSLGSRPRNDRQASHSPLIPTAEELRTGQWQPEPEHPAPPRSIQGLQSAVALEGAATQQQQYEQQQQQAPANTYITQAAQHLAMRDAPADQHQAPTNHAASQFNQTAATQAQQPQAQDTLTRIDQPRQGPGVIHYVKRGETLSQISRRYYGQDQHWKLIAKANPGEVDKNGGVIEGARLVIPGIANTNTGHQEIDITPRGGAITAGASQPSRNRIVTVEVGDTLSRLAARHLGDAKRYRDIYQLNRDQLKSENALVVGMKLRLPIPATPAPTPGSTPAPQTAPAIRPVPTTSASASASAPNTNASRGKTYTVVAGDTLSKIAAKTLGDSARYKDIFEANRRLLASADDLEVGQELRIP